MRKVLVIHGPNLNILGQREPEIYGPATLDSINQGLVSLAQQLGVDLKVVQSNHEGEIVTAIQQAMTLLSNSMQNLGNTRDLLGVQEQSLSTINTQISNEQLNLQSAMSTNYDTDMASAISDYTSAQITYQATLQTTASIMKMTLLSYI